MNVVIFFYLLAVAPKILWERIMYGKRHPGFLQRIGLRIPHINQPVIWIHAVSVGEVKSAKPLYLALKEQNPRASFLITTTSQTGQEEAKRSLPGAVYAYLPIDLSFVVRRFVKKIKPSHCIFVESDFWPNLLKALKKNKTKIALVSGKISEKSFNRFFRFRFFAKKLFSHFDLIGVQNEEYQKRYLALVDDQTKVHITGNLKLDIPTQKTDKLELPKKDVITISCTHNPEEEMLLDQLIDLDLFFILAPRHPERFSQVAEMLTKKGILFSKWSEGKIEGKVLLVDAMGKLPTCYAHSKLAILGGSFVEDIGGHNPIEPCQYGAAVFFGPHMFGQKELALRVLNAGAGKQMQKDVVLQEVLAFYESISLQNTMRKAASFLIEEGRGVTKKTLERLS